MKSLLHVFVGILILAACQNQAEAAIEYPGYVCNMVNQTSVWVADDDSINLSEMVLEQGFFSSALDIENSHAATHSAVESSVFADESNISVEYHGSASMERYDPVDRAEVHSYISVSFTISSPCSYQTSGSSEGSIGESLVIFHHESGEILLRSQGEEEFEISGRLVEPGTYTVNGGLRQVDFPEDESHVEGQYSFEFVLAEESAVATEDMSFGNIKSLYR